MRSIAVVSVILALLTPSADCAGIAELKVMVSEQKLLVVRDGRPEKEYPVSTSRYGTGSRQLSNQTPLGKHLIAKKIGSGAPLFSIFRNRVPTGKIAKANRSKKPVSEDLITTRILWLRGLEPGLNQGRRVDSFHRLIYIHGTPDEGLIGTPSSHGCIRMKNRDVVDLYDRVDAGTPVEILP